MRIILICFNLLLSTINVLAQNENNIWYFGNYAGLDFNSGTPVSLNNGVLDSYDNTSTISDSAGNLLFYTNGENVWNANSLFMTNGQGIGGSNTGGQAALIIRQPFQDSIYYIFTADAFGASGGLKYSIVNMHGSGGLGTVTQKGIVLQDTSTEKLAGIHYCVGKFTWLITHKGNSNEFYCYKIKANGLDTVPVISAVGQIHPAGPWGTVNNTAGQMSISKTGSKIGCVQFQSGKIEVFDFDLNTGIVSNPILLNSTYQGAWGLEFSPDGTKMYLSVYTSPNIRQFDVTLGNANAISASAISVGSTSTTACPGFSGAVGYLQRGPDDKIYIAHCGLNYLSVINEPNKAGLLCDFVDNGVQLGNRVSTFGLSRAIANECMNTGVDDIALININTLFPNPNNGTFSIDISNATEIKLLDLKIFDALGKLVFAKKSVLSDFKNIQSNLDPGYYTVLLDRNNEKVIKKMIVY